MSPSPRPTGFIFTGPPNKASGHDSRKVTELQFQALGLESYLINLGAWMDVPSQLHIAYANPDTGTLGLSLLAVTYSNRFQRSQFETSRHKCQIRRQREECQPCESLLLGYETG
jgi:hypothetical protein